MSWWIFFALIAMLANAGKVFVVNRLCQGISSRLLVLVSRIISAAFLLPILISLGNWPSDWGFWVVVIITSVLTAAASILFTKAVKDGRLSVIMPMQTAVPVFAFLTLVILYRELPNTSSIVFMFLSMAALGYTLHECYLSKDNGDGKFYLVLYSLAAAVIFGVCTILDRIAVSRADSGALAYSACWNMVSVAVVSLECLRAGNLKIAEISGGKWAGILIFAMLNLVAFYFQQLGIEKSLGIHGAVVNVKAIIMLYLTVVIIVEHFTFKKATNIRVLIGGLVAIISGVGLLLSAAR
jgi:drug/metabolite transporter (DMT)-like permease